MGKIEDLDKLKKLKDDGSITEKEFEIEKYKILNNYNDKTNTSTNSTKGILVLGIITLLLGIITLLLCLVVPILGLILAIISLIICIMAKKRVEQTGTENKLVTVGLILAIIGLLVTALMHIGALVIFIINFV